MRSVLKGLHPGCYQTCHLFRSALPPPVAPIITSFCPPMSSFCTPYLVPFPHLTCFGWWLVIFQLTEESSGFPSSTTVVHNFVRSQSDFYDYYRLSVPTKRKFQKGQVCLGLGNKLNMEAQQLSL